MSKDDRQQLQAQLDTQLLECFETHRDFTRVFLDAFILINAQRKILKFNQMYCSIAGVRAVDVKRSNSTDDLMFAEIPGTTANALEFLLTVNGPMRVDEVRAKRANSDEYMYLIMSSFPYFDASNRLLGACIVMRDVTAETNLQDKYKERTIQSFTDPLTGLFTRRFFEDWVDKEIARCKEIGKQPTLGLLMFDLDKFKTVNDTYGHQAGDFVLTETAKILRELCRKTDIIGRFGGEELLVLLLGADPEGACIAAEKFRQAIAGHVYTFDGKTIPVTTSVGVSLFLSNDETREIVVARADKCLYAAKDAGRNVAFADFGNGEKRVPTLVEPVQEKK